MNKLLIYNSKQIICEEIDCTKPLEYFDIKNGSRFCHSCRVSGKELRWKCKGCANILTTSQCRETRKFCDDCKGLSIKF